SLRSAFRALSRSRMASSRTSYGVSASHGIAASAGESALRASARSVFMIGFTRRALSASTHRLYVTRALPNHWRSVWRTAAVGCSRYVRVLSGSGGGFSSSSSSSLSVSLVSLDGGVGGGSAAAILCHSAVPVSAGTLARKSAALDENHAF